LAIVGLPPVRASGLHPLFLKMQLTMSGEAPKLPSPPLELLSMMQFLMVGLLYQQVIAGLPHPGRMLRTVKPSTTDSGPSSVRKSKAFRALPLPSMMHAAGPLALRTVIARPPKFTSVLPAPP